MAIPAFREDGWLPIGHHPALWEEVVAVFGGASGSRREALTQTLLHLRDTLHLRGIKGIILLDGSYISIKAEPSDFDVLLIASADIQVQKDADPVLTALLDASHAERNGYSVFFIPENSRARELLSTLWDISKEGIPKGIIQIALE